MKEKSHEMYTKYFFKKLQFNFLKHFCGFFFFLHFAIKYLLPQKFKWSLFVLIFFFHFGFSLLCVFVMLSPILTIFSPFYYFCWYFKTFSFFAKNTCLQRVWFFINFSIERIFRIHRKTDRRSDSLWKKFNYKYLFFTKYAVFEILLWTKFISFSIEFIK